jgi:hypothetical protein
MDSHATYTTELAGKAAGAPDGQPDGERGERFSVEESQGLASEARRGRELDRQLARDLERAQANVGAVSSGYIRGLGERPGMAPSVERRLV